MAQVIDSHHHFWKYSPQEYSWIGEGQRVLKRDFLPADLKKEIEAAKVDGVVSVQARQTVEETRWLPQLQQALAENRFRDIRTEYLTAYGSAIVSAQTPDHHSGGKH